MPTDKGRRSLSPALKGRRSLSPATNDHILAVVCRNVAALRLEPDPDSEQDTQISLGQRAFVLERSGDWTRIETWDGCTGWVTANAVSPIADGATAYASHGSVARIRDLFAGLHSSADSDSPIITRAVIGSLLELVRAKSNWLEVRLPLGTAAVSMTTDAENTTAFVRTESVDIIDASTIPVGRSSTQEPPDPAMLIETAMGFVGVPYLWGGTTSFGIDCSGFVQLLHRFHFYNLPRNSRTQAADPRGVPVSRDELQPGDLVFFGKGRDPEQETPPLPPLQGEGDSSLSPPQGEGNPFLPPLVGEGKGGVRHVGIALDANQFIHSAGISGVAVTTFDSPRYRDIYWGARRLAQQVL